jgi:hypothetical protein
MCSVETNETVKVQQSGLSEAGHPTSGEPECLRPATSRSTANKSRLSILGSAESRPATSGATLLTTHDSTLHCSTLSTTLGNAAAGLGSSAHPSDPQGSSTNYPGPMAPTASVMRQPHPRLYPPH